MKSSSARGHEVDLLRYVHAAGTIDSTATVLSERGVKIKRGRYNKSQACSVIQR